MPSVAAAAAVSSRRWAASRSDGRVPSGASPSSPPVATTSTTRCPAAVRRAIVPPVKMASSSGWAWTNTIVSGGLTGPSLAARHGEAGEGGRPALACRHHAGAAAAVQGLARGRATVISTAVGAAATTTSDVQRHRAAEGGLERVGRFDHELVGEVGQGPGDGELLADDRHGGIGRVAAGAPPAREAAVAHADAGDGLAVVAVLAEGQVDPQRGLFDRRRVVPTLDAHVGAGGEDRLVVAPLPAHPQAVTTRPAQDLEHLAPPSRLTHPGAQDDDVVTDVCLHGHLLDGGGVLLRPRVGPRAGPGKGQPVHRRGPPPGAGTTPPPPAPARPARRPPRPPPGGA